MRILLVSQYFYPENFAINQMALELMRRGHEVEVLTGQPNYGFGKIKEGYENVFEEEWNGLKIHRVKTHPRGNGSLKDLLLNYLTFWRNSKKRVRSLPPSFDVVYSMSFSPLIGVVAANVYAQKNKVKNVLHVLDLWPASPVAVGAVKEGSLFYHFLYLWSRSIYKKAHTILISSPSFRDYFHDVLEIKDKEIIYVPQPALAIASDHRPNLSHEVFNLVYSGNVGKLQLLENILESMALLPEGFPVRLHVIGGGSCLNEAVSKIEKLGLQNAVSLYGRLDAEEVAGYLDEADGLIVSLHDDGSSVSRTLPNKLLTSLYHGRPILGIIGGDGRDTLMEAGGAVLSKSEDPKDIAEAVLSLAHKPKEELKKMGEANRAYYDRYFDFRHIMDQLENVLLKSSRKD